MKRALLTVSIAGFSAVGAFAASPACEFEKLDAGSQKLGDWVGKHNWLAIENHAMTLGAANTFMPALRLNPVTADQTKSTGSKIIDGAPAIDPLDASQRDLGFLLDSRLHADGLVVLHNGRIVVERYRNGLVRERPRLLLAATRPFLNLLGAVSVSQGKLAADKSVARHLPAMGDSTGLRKLSVQRLLDSKEVQAWSVEDRASWKIAAGWENGLTSGGIRAWLSESGRWNKAFAENSLSRTEGTPEDDLLAWLLAESNGIPIAKYFCEQLLGRIDRDDEVLWLTDPNGVELASGLAMSLRDFAKLGQLLIDTRSGRNRNKIPSWFLETLLASSGIRSQEIPGLTKGSEHRYGFTHLGGAPNRVALVGAHGTSLYIDFDKRLVVALYGSRPGSNSPGTLALLEQTWRAVDIAVGTFGKQRSR